MSTDTPYPNCRFKYCDLPGQCQAEGKCHHPESMRISDLERTLATKELAETKLREALGFYANPENYLPKQVDGLFAGYVHGKIHDFDRGAIAVDTLCLSTPITTEALDSYVAEKVKEAPVANEMAHDLYKDGDEGIPQALLDRNGQVVLNQCKRCRRAEGELSEPCAVESDRLDAERYRWLRGHFMHVYCADDDTDAGNFNIDAESPAESLDDAIDNAIAQPTEQPK